MLGGKGTDQTETNQQATNNQVATESGYAFGAGWNNSNVDIKTLDAEVAKAAIESNASVAYGAAQMALNSNTLVASRAIDSNTVVSGLALNAVNDTASLALISNASLAQKYGDLIGAGMKDNIALLQSVAGSQSNLALKNTELTSQSIKAAQDIAGLAAPVSEGNLGLSSMKTMLYVGIAAVAGVVLIVVFKKK